MGDFNARIGQDHQSWSSCIGHHGVGKINENGQRLLELCSSMDLCITNTYFDLKDHLKKSWQHPRSKHWHQLDFVLTRRKQLNTVKITRAFHSADCNTDHALIVSKVKMSSKRKHMSSTKAKCKINTTAMKDTNKKIKFQQMFTQRMSDVNDQGTGTVDEKWDKIEAAIYESAIECFGEGKASNLDWVEANANVLIPLIEKKRTALLQYKKSPNQQTKDALSEAKATVQRETRRCANDYWIGLCKEIQSASDMGDTRQVHKLLKTALGPTTSKTAKLKAEDGTLIEDKEKQLERWVQHYSKLYSEEIPIKPGLDAVLPSFPEFVELDEPPAIEELREAIEALSNGKATGEDNIPAEILKENTELLLPQLHDLLNQCWFDCEVPHKMRNAKIVTLYKNKGDKGDCNNYRGISLLSITGKVFARVLLKRLQRLAERLLPESQCGFRSCRSTIDMIFTLRQLQEKCREQDMPLYTAFVDLTKAFDTVSRPTLYRVLESIGCPPLLLQLVISFHEDMKACVQYEGSTSEYLDVRSGVKQGCILAPTLFGIYFAALLHCAFNENNDGIFIRTRSDGSLFKLSRLKSMNKTTEVLIRELLFADDAAITAHSNEALQRLMDRLEEACKIFSLTISVKKTEVLGQGTTTTPPEIFLNGNQLKNTEKFVYLGSTIASSLSLDEEINMRIGKAATTFGKLTKRAWENEKLTTKTKVLIYQACVVTSLLYGCESWTLYAHQERKLNTFHLRCLRKILGIKWQDKVTNNEVLKKAVLQSMFTILRKRRLRWLGHVDRMDESRIPKQMLYSELSKGTRKRGRPRLRYKDVCKSTLKDFNIPLSSWREKAQDRDQWKSELENNARLFENSRREVAEEKRQRRKHISKPEANINVNAAPQLKCRICGRQCKAKIGLISHERHCTGPLL